MPTLAASSFKKSAGVNTTSLVSDVLSPNNGDVLVVKVSTQDDSFPNVVGVSGGGQTWTERVSRSIAGDCQVWLWTTTVSGSPAPFQVTTTYNGAGGQHSMCVERWTSAELAATPALIGGASGTVVTGAPSTTITTTGTNSVVTWVIGDWNAVTSGTPTYRSSATEIGNDRVAGAYCAYYAYQTAATAGSQTVGMTAPTGQRASVAGIEILDTAPSGGSVSAVAAQATSAGVVPSISATTEATVNAVAAATVNVQALAPNVTGTGNSQDEGFSQVVTGTGNTASVEVAFPAQAAGTVLWLSVAAGAVKAADPSGWTLLDGQVTNHAHYVWYKVSDGTETTVTYDLNTAVQSVYWLGAETGADAANLIDVAQGTFLRTPGAFTATTPTVSTTAGPRLAIAFMGATAPVALPITGAGSWTNSYAEVGDNSASGATDQNALAVAYLTFSGGGDTDTTVTWTGNPPEAITQIIAVTETVVNPNASIVAPVVTASGSAPPPAALGGSGGSNINATRATSSAPALAPIVTGGTGLSVDPPATTGSAEAKAPAVGGETAVSGGGAVTSTAQAYAPTLTTTGAVTVTRAMSSASGRSPVVDAESGTNGSVSAVTATASALALEDVATSTGVLIAGLHAVATAAGVGPSVVSQDALFTAIAAHAVSLARVPTVTTGALVYHFTPPTTVLHYDTGPLMVRIPWVTGLSILKIDGFYQQLPFPDDEQIENAESAFIGGHDYIIDADTAAELTNAGYGDNITTEIVEQ